MMYDDILFPTDGQAGTERAMVQALDFARGFESAIHTLYVIDTGQIDETLGAEQETLLDHLESQGQTATLDVQNRATDLGLDTSRQIREGRPYETILEYAEEKDIDLIVMGTRGRATAGEHHLGSTTQRVLTRADVPVLTVSLDGNEAVPETEYGMYDRVLIPTDGSDAATRASEHALRVAERYGADVRVVYVVDTNTYSMQDSPRSIVGLLKEGGQQAVEAIAADARERNLPVSTAILRGIPDEAILQYADGAGTDLIAMGTRGKSAGNERVLGSTTARIVRRSSTPVLTVR